MRIKASGEFTPEAQKAAFEKTLHAVTDILSEDAKEYLTEAFGDLEAYITALIEATVKRVKNDSVARLKLGNLLILYAINKFPIKCPATSSADHL